MPPFNRKKQAFLDYLSKRASSISGLFLKLVRKDKSGNDARSAFKDEFDKKLVYSLSKSKMPSLKQIRYVRRFLSPKEIWVIRIASLIILVSLSYLGVRFYQGHISSYPVGGGAYNEGIVGTIKYINPLYSSLNDSDKDLERLIFSALFRMDSSGKLMNDLAQSFETSPDGKTYTIKIRQGAKFHNGDDVTAGDVVFTFLAITNPDYKSPLRTSFIGVTIEETEGNIVRFKLSEPYAGFPDLLTFGIMPQGLWNQVQPASALLAELNIKPIGSGPYKFKSVVKDKNGTIRSLNLTASDGYYGRKPYIPSLSFIFYPSYEESVSGLNADEVGGLGNLPKEQIASIISKDSLNFHILKTAQIDLVFFNSKNNRQLESKKTRQALSYAISKDRIIEKLGADRYYRADGPLVSFSSFYKEDKTPFDNNIEQALKLFKEDGWEQIEITDQVLGQAGEKAKSGSAKEKEEANRTISMGKGKWLRKKGEFLKLKLSTAERSDYSIVATEIKSAWESIGVKTQLELVPSMQIQMDTIKPKNFEALLYGIAMNPDSDLFSFWHSKQIDKGFNLANYSNKEADKLIEEARKTVDPVQRKQKFDRLQDLIKEDAPAIFLYSPFYYYINQKSIKGFEGANIYAESDRFSNITDWYIRTGKSFKW